MILIFILALVFLGFIISPLIKRIALVRKLKRLAKRTGARLTLLTSPILSLFRLRRRTEIMLETDKRIYMIRLVSSQGARRIIHFASERFVVSFTRVKYQYVTRGAAFGARKLFANIAVFAGDIVNRNIKVRILPEHELPSVKTEKPIVKVLLFNPAPLAVTCVSNGKTRINIASVEDTLYGEMVFTGSSFVSHIERNDDKINESEATGFRS